MSKTKTSYPRRAIWDARWLSVIVQNVALSPSPWHRITGSLPGSGCGDR